jgi:hypothetical protein
MIRRRLGLGAAVTALTVPLAGCVTVHGERALIPSVRAAEASKVLANFAAQNNKATKAYDEQDIASIEAGPLGDIDRAGVRAKHANNPRGNPAYSPLAFSDQKFLIPEQRGWPKFFVAEAKTNRSGDSRWLLAFRRGSSGQPWKADFLGVAAPAQLPDFAVDKHGYAQPVPLAGTDLPVQPGQLSAQYADYLDAPKATGDFADGPWTSGLRTAHEKNQQTASTVSQYADQADTDGDFTPIALRTKDGGAVVFFGSRHQSKSTFRPGGLRLDKDTQALTTGTPKTSITLTQVAQEMVTVPPASGAGSKGASKDGAGQVVFISRLVGLVSAKGA